MTERTSASYKQIIIFFIFLLILFGISSGKLFAQEKFYNYYDNGLKYMEKGDWLRAAEEFKSAISLEFEDAKRKRTYGTRFIQYFPHRELGIVYYKLEEFDRSMGELQLSIAYKFSKRAKEYVDKLSYARIPRKIIIPMLPSTVKVLICLHRSSSFDIALYC